MSAQRASVRSGKACCPDVVNAPYCRIEVASANPIQAHPAVMAARGLGVYPVPAGLREVGIVHDRRGIGSVMAGAVLTERTLLECPHLGGAVSHLEVRVVVIQTP